MTPAQFRKMALSMPGAVEGAHHGHPDFRCGGRIFASLQPDGERAMVKVPPADMTRLVKTHGGTFEPATGAWGRAGCTMVRLADVTSVVLKDAMTLAWQTVAAGPPPRRSRR